MQLRIIIYILLFSFTVFWGQSFAAGDSSLYLGQVAVAGQTPDDWQRAVTPAFKQVLIRVSNNPKIDQNPVIRAALPKAGNYVQSYNYVSNDTGKATSIQIRFSQKAVDRLLQQLNPVTAVDVAPVPKVEKNPTLAAVPAPQVAHKLEVIQLQINGIHGLDDYASLLEYLRKLNTVAAVNTKQMNENNVVLSLDVKSTRDELMKEIAASQQLASPMIANNSINYQWMGTPVGPQPEDLASTLDSSHDESWQIEDQAVQLLPDPSLSPNE
jgi:hypothetical protein